MAILTKARLLFVSYWQHVKRECRGTFTIEFALILPLMIIVYVGAVEIGNALTAWRRTDQVAYTVADLTAQARSLSGEQIQKITKAADNIMAPYSTENLTIVLTSVVADDKNRPKVAWSCTNGKGTPLKKNSPVNLPEGLTEAGSSVIMAKVEYDYAPAFGIGDEYEIYGMKFAKIDMERTFYSRPRRSAEVVNTDNSC